MSTSAALRVFALTALLASVMGRALVPALPGSQAGIGPWIVFAEWTCAALTQAAAVFGSLLAIRVLLSLRRADALGRGYWLLTIPTILTVSLVSAAMQGQLAPRMIQLLGVLSAVTAMIASTQALSRPATRAVGLVLGATSFSALLHMASRLIAIDASERAVVALFDVSRNLATLALGLDAVVVVVALAWLAPRGLLRRGIALSVFACLTAACVVMAQREAHYDAGLAQVLVGRSLSELVRHPLPFTPLWVRQAFEVMSLLIALGVVFWTRHPASLQVALGLALLSRTGSDVPALALFLVVAALLCLVEPSELGLSGSGNQRAEHDH
ncbi:MAG TPA: hypothetical protein VK524_13845 [Polyangiaceae bacterium]|nr:hypothetical protein [Polyangiaceae bacterium]